MRRRQTFVPTSALMVLLATLVAGCGTGGTGGAGGGMGGPHPLASLDELCFGITGNMILSATAPEYSRTLSYMGGEPNAGSTTPLTIRVRYEQGAITCNPPVSHGPTGPSEGAHVTVQVQADFVTGDGAFAETLAAELDGFSASAAHLTGKLAAAAIMGTYDPNMPGLTNVTVTLDGSVAGATTTGTVLKGGQKSASSGEVAFVASW